MLPGSWTDALDRLGRALGGPAEAEEWLRQAVRAAYGRDSLHDLTREERHVAFQRTCGVVLACEEAGWPDEVVDGATGRLSLWWRDGTIDFDPGPRDEAARPRRARVAEIFARYFGGVVVDGPPWRLSPREHDRPAYEEWSQGAEFPLESGTG